jgi:hypothetical protein
VSDTLCKFVTALIEPFVGVSLNPTKAILVDAASKQARGWCASATYRSDITMSFLDPVED